MCTVHVVGSNYTETSARTVGEVRANMCDTHADLVQVATQ